MTKPEEMIFRTVADLVTQFVTRYRDYLLTKDMLEEAITTGMVTKAQIVGWFSEELDKYFPDEQGGSRTST